MSCRVVENTRRWGCHILFTTRVQPNCIHAVCRSCFGAPAVSHPCESHVLRQATIAYIHELVVTYGPFDGIAGFSEGAATMHEMMCLQASGVDVGLGGIKFCIAMSPWISPHRATKLPAPLAVQLLSTHGRKDSRMFQDSLPLFEADFTRVQRFEHDGTSL